MPAGMTGGSATSLPSWAPHGAALRDFLAGRLDAEVIVRGEDGDDERTPARVFFRDPKEFSALDEAARALADRGLVREEQPARALHRDLRGLRGK